MSVSVDIITKKQIAPKQIFDKLVEHGECIMVVSGDFPSLKFGTMNYSLRGLEINQEKDGYEVRAFSCSSDADYKLFAVAVDVLMKLTDLKAVTEEGETVSNPYESFGQRWIESQKESSRNVICAMVRHSGTEIVMRGMFFPFCIGINILREFGVALRQPSKKSFSELLDYFIHIQWHYRDSETTSSRLCIQNPKDEKDRPLGISLISIENNQLNDFEIVTHSDLVGFIDMDRDETVLIHFEDFRKTINNKKFSRIDECQYRNCGELNVDDVRNMMNLAKRFQPDDLFSRPSFPGSGYDANQNTFILMWNPGISSVTEDGFVESMVEMYEGWFNWSVFEWEKAKMGDRFYLVRVGDGEGTGVVMAGVFGSQPYKSEDWSGRKRVVYYMDLYPNVIINPKISPILSTEELEKAIPDYKWRGGHSGIMLNSDQAQKLEAAFSVRLSNVEEGRNDDSVLIRHRV